MLMSMKLKTYIDEQPGSASAFAKSIGVSPAYLYQMTNGIRPVPVQLVATIKRVTGGAVAEQDLRPDDWHLIWPELAATELKVA